MENENKENNQLCNLTDVYWFSQINIRELSILFSYFTKKLSKINKALKRHSSDSISQFSLLKQFFVKCIFPVPLQREQNGDTPLMNYFFNCQEFYYCCIWKKKTFCITISFFSLKELLGLSGAIKNA